MQLDLDELKFCGMVASAAEREFSASVIDDEDISFARSLYSKYIAEGKPKGPRAWISKELRKHFVGLVRLPAWVEAHSVPPWPFLEGKPMQFVDQLVIPDLGDPTSLPMAGTVLYVFCSAKQMPGVENGWEMVYRVVDQHPET